SVGFSTQRIVSPRCITAPMIVLRPPTQKKGIPAYTFKPNGSSVWSATLAVCRTQAPWVWTTPFGSAVVPDVKITTIGSAGTTERSTASRKSAFAHTGGGGGAIRSSDQAQAGPVAPPSVS